MDELLPVTRAVRFLRLRETGRDDENFSKDILIEVDTLIEWRETRREGKDCGEDKNGAASCRPQVRSNLLVSYESCSPSFFTSVEYCIELKRSIGI